MRISKLRVLDRLWRIRLEMPVYEGGDRVTDWLLAEGLVNELVVPAGRRITVSSNGAEAIRVMGEAERKGELRGCWGDAEVNTPRPRRITRAGVGRDVVTR